MKARCHSHVVDDCASAVAVAVDTNNGYSAAAAVAAAADDDGDDGGVDDYGARKAYDCDDCV
uniref:Uncharacterized protein n=1 Tax=Glossina pallidipes TaxID=7398 RepID=A0A1A9ZQP1_GLOPL